MAIPKKIRGLTKKIGYLQKYDNLSKYFKFQFPGNMEEFPDFLDNYYFKVTLSL